MNSDEQQSIDTVFEIIQEITTKTADGIYIYRGEPEHYEKVSSSLWRECRTEIGEDEFNIEAIQQQMIEVAKDYTRETDEFEILTELQHFGGHTNLIDFTTDSNIALFFACDGFPNEDGRLILLKRTGEIKDVIKSPRNPQNRVISQKSVFVQPPKGYIETDQFTEIDIPRFLKRPILDLLQRQHGISTQTIYNDLHGFIRNQAIHQETYIRGYEVGTQPMENVYQITTSQLNNDKDT